MIALKARVEGYQRDTGCQEKEHCCIGSVGCNVPVLRGDADNREEIFAEVNSVYEKSGLGDLNVIATFVHYDETTPHCQRKHTVLCGRKLQNW